MYSDKEHCMCKPNKYDTTSLPIHQAGRNIGMSAALPKWLAKYESHSNIFNEMTAKHSALFLVICFTSEKNTAILCGVPFLLIYSIIHLLQSYQASFSRCGFSFCLRRTNWDTGQLCTFNSAFGYGGYGLWTSSWSLYCRWTVQSRFFTCCTDLPGRIIMPWALV